MHVWAYPVAGGLPIFVGAAAYGQDRGDLQAFFGFGPITAGHRLSVSGLPGRHLHDGRLRAQPANQRLPRQRLGRRDRHGTAAGRANRARRDADCRRPAGRSDGGHRLGAGRHGGDPRRDLPRSVAGETGEISVGDATFVEGARPDVAAAYPCYPGSTRAGWGEVIDPSGHRSIGHRSIGHRSIGHRGEGSCPCRAQRRVASAHGLHATDQAIAIPLEHAAIQPRAQR
jgi:hypothetical protein